MISPTEHLTAIRGIDASTPSSKSPRREPSETSLIGILPVHQVRMEEAAAASIQHARQVRSDHSVGHAMQIFGVNAQIATMVLGDQRLARAMLSANLLYPDGISIIMASRLLGRPLERRIPGGEFMDLLCKQGAKEGFSVYFLGGLPSAAEKTAAILQANYPGLKIAGVCCPPVGFEKVPEQAAAVVRSIQNATPDMLFVGFGVPKQETWILDNSSALPVGLVFPVGAAFDTAAGLRKRAPVWARKTGCEWLYRLVMEPRRLWRRYLVGNTTFVFMILKQWMRERWQPLRSSAKQ